MPQDAAVQPREQEPSILVADGENAPRWQPGERLHHLFEALARDGSTAAAPAVHGGGEIVSFAGLDARANRLARHLRGRGIRSGDVVALAFPRCIDSYVAMLATLKLHAAYVPLDPGFPADRIGFICKDAGVSAILTLADLAGPAAQAEVAVIALDTDAVEIDACAADPLAGDETGAPVSDLAYVIYTSGSTGWPKGVPIEHCSIVNFVRVAAESYGYRPGDRVYQGLTLAFDFSVEEIWVPLLAGATLVPNESGANLVGDELAEFLAQQEVTALCCVPTLLATIERALPDLRLLIVSGEACPPDIVRRWHRPDRTILNAYGPTEITVTATVARLDPDAPVTIGMPLPSYSIAILAPGSLRILDRGQVGEIAIAGIGVSPGYLNRPDQTEKAFVPDTLGLPHNSSGRIYRSGDLGRIDAQGRIEYLGRIDTQVKIRGYRIEVTEIESRITRLPGINQAVVTKHTPAPGIDELAAYYTVVEGAETAPERLAERLAETLPGFMVPTWYTRLDTIPMLPSDKADRNALPEPARRLSGGSRGKHEQPATDREAELARILATLMGAEEIGVTDDFFAEIGANSLIMARFAARLRQQTDLGRVAMRDFYDRPTIRELANHLDETTADLGPIPAPDKRASFTAWQACRTGALQLIATIGYSTLMVWISFLAIDWTFRATGPVAIYAYSVAMSLGMFLFAFFMPVALKWLLAGRMDETRYPVYSLKYVRIWIVQALIRSNPVVLYAGTPLYNLYLNMLGARVSLSALVMGLQPMFPDLVRIGPRSVVSVHADIGAYRAEAGEIIPGRIDIGADAFVGVGSTVDVGTRIEDGGELGHGSALHEGQTIPEGEAWHGAPARPADTRFRRVPHGPPSRLRMALYSLTILVPPILVLGPTGFAIMRLLYDTKLNSPLEAPPGMLQVGALGEALAAVFAVSFAVALVLLLLGFASVMILPRLARIFLRPGETYPLYGFRHWLVGITRRASNSSFFNVLFGDSVLITRYLGGLGYRFDRIFQTGSNFGTNQGQDTPFLCRFGHKVMSSDGLYMANAEYSGSSVRLGEIHFGDNTYLGNYIYVVPGGAIGDNVLVGTKTAIPIDGPIRSDTGLLGSPAFQIPRSVERDRRLATIEDDAQLRHSRLAAKTRHNLLSMAYFLGKGLLAAFISISIFYGLAIGGGAWSPFFLALTGFSAFLALLVTNVLVEHWSRGFRALQPTYCSIYDRGFWAVERYWKLASDSGLGAFRGTPLRPILWRLLGVKVGRGVFDDGVGVSERTMVTIGDHATLNRGSYIESHSLEDGVFKSDRIAIGSGVTLAPHAYVHYGVVIEDGAWIAPDSFVMKGETVDAGHWWHGNPAMAKMGERPAPARLTVQPTVPAEGLGLLERKRIGLKPFDPEISLQRIESDQNPISD